jgi:hypothetical protein
MTTALQATDRSVSKTSLFETSEWNVELKRLKGEAFEGLIELGRSTLYPMCGRLAFGKGFSGGNAGLVGAAMCSASSCGTIMAAGRNAFSAGAGPDQEHALETRAMG